MKKTLPRLTWDSARNMLCVRLDSMGDVLMTTPAMRALKDSLPGRRITLLASPAGGEVAPLIPLVDDVIVYEAPWMKATPPRDNSQCETQMVETLKQGAYDGVVIFTVFSQNPLPAALMCYLAGIPLRAAHCHENPYQLLTDWILDPEPAQTIRHEVRRQLDLVSALGCTVRDERLVLTIPDDDQRRMTTRLRRAGIDLRRPWITIHPGATAPSRRYDPAGFARAARILAEVYGVQVVFTGNQHESDLIASIQKQAGVPSVSLAGKLGLGELAAVLALTPLLIANNTGPVHMAAALGTPIVDLYALTNPQHTPWMTLSRVLFSDVPCKFCYKSICPEGHHNCLARVSPETVVAAVLELLRLSPAANLSEGALG